MYVKIFFNDKPLFLCDAIDSVIEPFLHHDDAIFIDELDSHSIKAMIHEMQLDKVHAGVFFHPDLEELKKSFFKKFRVIQAGGGAVINENDEVLMIYRKGFWDLPKGKLDKGERLEECAIREIKEETGLQNVKIVSPLSITYHTYHEGTKFILKESHWYNMAAKKDQHIAPQQEEGIEEIKWVHKKELSRYYPVSYPSVADVLKQIAE